MLKIESNLKINGRHWGLQFADGIAYTASVALAAKLLLKGYVVTDQPDQPVADLMQSQQANAVGTSSHEQENAIPSIGQPEVVPDPAIEPIEATTESPSASTRAKITKPRKKVVTADVIDAG